jgi:hypothetical protein
MREKLVKFRMLVDVDIEANGVRPDILDSNLRNGIKHLVDNGLITRDNPALCRNIRISVKRRK